MKDENLPMDQTDELKDLLRILVQLNARSAFPEEDLRQIVLAGRASSKHLNAYNLCDGTRALSEVARKARVDQGNFTRTVARWVSLGVMFRIGSGRDARLLHLYPLHGINRERP